MYIKAYRRYSDNCMRYINYINGGSFFESVEDPIGGKFKIYQEADDDPDPDVSKAEDDENPEVSDSTDDENPEVSDDDTNDTSSNDGTSNDSDTSDNSSTDNTDNEDDSSNNDNNDDTSSSSDNTSSNNSDNDDENTDDGSDDMDSDPHDVSDDDEDPDASGNDSNDSKNGNSESDDKKEDKPGTDFENMRRYNLYKKFMSMNDSINGYTDTLDALVYDDPELNDITKLASLKLKKLSEITYDYMTMKFEGDTYTQALLFYHQVNAAIRMCFDLLENKNANIQKRA